MSGAMAAALGRSVGRGLIELVLPRYCPVCERPTSEERLVCGVCWMRVERLEHPQCGRCGHPLGDAAPGPVCRWCAPLPPWVRAVRSFAWTDRGTGAAIVHALKYGGWWRIGEEIGARLAPLPWPDDVVRERAMVLPVPLAPARRRERGYNQSAVIAAAVARAWRLPSREDLLARTRATRTQTRLTPGDRLANVSGAFAAVPASRRALEGAHVVLVDDVITTGATLTACAHALIAAGARIVSYLTFARAPALGDR